jgi:hypothetical protein
MSSGESKRGEAVEIVGLGDHQGSIVVEIAVGFDNLGHVLGLSRCRGRWQSLRNLAVGLERGFNIAVIIRRVADGKVESDESMHA